MSSLPGETKATAVIANEMLNEDSVAGQSVALPKVVDDDDLDPKKFYPSTVWVKANMRRAEMSTDERAAKEAHFQELDGPGQVIRLAVFAAFLASFGVLDVVWGLLAAASAYKICVIDIDR